MLTPMTDGVGRVTTRTTTLFDDGKGLLLDCGRWLGPITVAWEQYGEMNADRSNVVLVCHALSGGAHAAGWHDRATKPGWWDGFIGPGRAFDTAEWCVVCTNVLGSCYGTTGPSSVDPAAGLAFGADFPVVTVWDMVRVQHALVEHLGIASLAAVAGGSMGGMQALAWPVLFPDAVRAVVGIATTDRHSAMQVALNEVARRAVQADPEWRGGRYEPGSGPAAGLAVARMLGHVTYLSGGRMERKFGRRTTKPRSFTLSSPEFEVERYLAHQGDSFVQRFDANSLLYLTKALDYFDLAELDGGSLEAAAERTRARFLLIAFESDWLYPPARLALVAETLHHACRQVEYHCLGGDDGHDAFLLDHAQQAPLIRRFLSRDLLHRQHALHPHGKVPRERADEGVIATLRRGGEGGVGRLAGAHQLRAGDQLRLDGRRDELRVARG
jgi:homoserine O-acetyltransferase/O-succinyltransferase